MAVTTPAVWVTGLVVGVIVLATLFFGLSHPRDRDGDRLHHRSHHLALLGV
jgi:hypothetical protein